ncbi:Hsp20/alpha crystallin family protein [Aquibacillus salsiterrae]|uniref:Hsp20 family protein n=1 Tax=Aquibacillus salsiterrae TaxID=2950439 RepID=A0A9X3WHC8_9BACI|nr:Hsp20 family protein [Aquibacillus salsiterrae]MDC3417479.1 Hsp20 family protein [Aquibacillus salsiterrae]
MDVSIHSDKFKNLHDLVMIDTTVTEDKEIARPQIPQMNLYKLDQQLICLINLPGLREPSDVEITVDNTILHIRGILDLQQDDCLVIKNEIIEGEFARTIELPFPIKKQTPTNITYQNGLLKLVF